MSETSPPVIHRATVLPEWIDRNGHFNAGYYMVLFDDAIGSWFDFCGMTTSYRQEHGVTTYTVESHTLYLRELMVGEEVEISGQLIEHDAKRVHTLLRMRRAEDQVLAATNEVLSLHIDRETRRNAPFGKAIIERLATIAGEQSVLAPPPQLRRRIGLDAGRPELD